MSTDFQEMRNIDQFDDRDHNIDDSLYDDYFTPGNPDDEDFKHHDDAFKEDLDDLSDYDESEEVKALQTRIEDLETQITTVEDERDNYRYKLMKEESNSKYLQEQLKDSQIQFNQLKERYTQLLTFKDSLETLNTPDEPAMPTIDTKETERLQSEIEHYKADIKEYRLKLIEEGEK